MAVSQGNIRTGHQGMSLKAWVKFNGATGAIEASYNIAALVRNFAGNYGVTFSAAMATALYVVPISSIACNSVAGTGIREVQLNPRTTAGCTLITKDGGAVVADAQTVYCEFYE